MSDEFTRISAYLDDQMSPGEKRAFENDLHADAALAERLSVQQKNDQLLKASFQSVMSERVDDALLARMGLGLEPVKQAANDNVGIWQKWRLPMGGALAASIALVIALQLGQMQSFDPALASALDTAPSAKIAQTGDGQVILPRLTFTTKDVRLCREFVSAKAGKTNIGIACRSNGGWSMEAMVAGGEAPIQQQEIVTASGQDGNLLEKTYKRLGASDPLSAGEEGQALAKINAGKPALK